MALRGSVARRYARALLMVAEEKKRAAEIGAELAALTGFFDKYPDLHTQLLSPALDLADRSKLIDSIIRSFKLSAESGTFLHLLSQKGRLEYLHRIQDWYRRLADDASGIVRAQVFSAHPIPGQIQERLVRALEKRVSKKVQAQFVTDKELIGGLKVQIGSLLLDGSVAAQLRRLEEDLKRV